MERRDQRKAERKRLYLGPSLDTTMASYGIPFSTYDWNIWTVKSQNSDLSVKTEAFLNKKTFEFDLTERRLTVTITALP